jgi:hypothetical protein
MLDPAEAGGGCLRNLGPHGLDLFPDVTGEEAQVTGAQISRRAQGQRVGSSRLTRSQVVRPANGLVRDEATRLPGLQLRAQ